MKNIGISDKSKSRKLGKIGTLTLKYIRITETTTNMLILTFVLNLKLTLLSIKTIS